jgi:hypothetical protein
LATAILGADVEAQDPLIPTLRNCDFVPLQPSFSNDDETADPSFEYSELDGLVTVQADGENEDVEILEAASILCMLSQARPSSEDILLTMDMLRPTFEPNEEYLDDEDMYEEPIVRLPSLNALRHPDRLSTPDDAEEVNRLHQYVRSDLLEIFVVPQIEEEDSDEEYVKPKFERVTRGSTYTGTLCTTQNRHYPGRVGFRCVHCANVRPASAQATKSAFYPLRLHNIYREVCAWQRIHFKNCPFVPREVRERYDWLKSSDTSRGKVRYWEVSAGKIGLENNRERLVFWLEFDPMLQINSHFFAFVDSCREDGIVFSNSVWQV